MTASSRAGALQFLVQWYALETERHNAPKDLGQLITQAGQIEVFLGEDYQGTDSAVLTEIRSLLEGLDRKMTELTQAFVDLNAAIDADATDKQTLKDEVANLQAQITALKGVNTTDEAALTAANAAVADAAGKVEAAAARLNPLPAPPVPDPTPTPAPAALPHYTYSGTDPVDSSWTPVAGTTPQEYTYSGDTAGQPATGDGLGGVWHLVPATA